MFHLYITLAYIIPNIYVFFRIKDLFISRGFRLWYVIVYLLIAAVYPLAGRDTDHEMNAILPVSFPVRSSVRPVSVDQLPDQDRFF
jgi:hypothetical protein